MTTSSQEKKEIEERLKKNYSKEKFGNKIAKVTGVGKKVLFNLRYLEVKHIRRCLRLYNNVHSIDMNDYSLKNADDLTIRLYDKFKTFGRMTRRMNEESKKRKLKKVQKKCSFEGCEETINLTLAHIKPLSSGMNMNSKDNLKLLCPKHHLLTDLKKILWRKKLEVEKLKNRINDIEKKGTTDCLGFQVLSKNKFVDELNVEPKEIKNKNV